MDGAAGDKPSAPGLEQVDPRPVLISSNSGMRPSGGEGLPRLSSKGMMQRTISLARTLTNDPREKARLQAQADTQQELAMQRREQANVDKKNPDSRYISRNIPEDILDTSFSDNSVTTSKYNLVTFLPLFLFEMFSRVAYLYFLIQAALSWWDVVSPFAGYGSTSALTFVLVAAAVKAVIEDKNRHAQDFETNNSPTIVMHWENGQQVEEHIKWRQVKVGDIIKVVDNELFPADLLCLYCAAANDVAYVKTTNLDGETNLKLRRQLLDNTLVGSTPTAELAMTTVLALECELPNSNLHHFRGKVVTQSGSDERAFTNITMNHMLLRGCKLKNSGYVLGLVIYTGAETRIQQNSAAAPLKIGSFDHFLNMQVAILIMAQIVLCVVCAVLNYSWRETEGKSRYYLDFDSNSQGNVENGLLYTLLVFITFWILYSYLVPISLFVTLEIVKLCQGFVFINSDRAMKDPETHENARCRNSNLNEDLGKIDYIFSDKTGTLTSNEMRLRMIAIKGQVYGDPSLRLEDSSATGVDALHEFDPKLAESLRMIKESKAWTKSLGQGGSSQHTLALSSSRPDLQKLAKAPEEEPFAGENGAFLPYHVVDFWTNIALCHGLLVEESQNGLPGVYQGPSPDEVALVEGARQLGFEFLGSSSSTKHITVLGQTIDHEMLQTMEFSSERQRMSVITRTPDGTIKLYCKGADSMMIDRLRADTDKALLERVDQNLHFFSNRGLRTLAIATRVLSADEYGAWVAELNHAKAQLTSEDSDIEKIISRIEQDLELVGVTAIEDKLQDAVPESIETLLIAGIKVWMITGDKQETAINIAVSCRLFKRAGESDLLILNADSKAASDAKIEQLMNRMREMSAIEVKSGQLVVDGKTLNHILGDADAEARLAELASGCGAVCVCRATPRQKANIVNMMRRWEIHIAQLGITSGPLRWLARQNRNLQGKLLSIGDGANDVAMIQAADVGIGIAGKEGRQAVNNSDYAITQFRFLTRLLLVHGQLSRYRLGRLIKYSFYKNSCFAFVLFFFQFFCGFSGQTLVDDISAAVYNVVFTSLPILLFAVLDKPLKFETMVHYPQTYNRSNGLSTRIFWKTGALHGILDAAVCFFIPYLASSPYGANSVTDIFSVGKTVFICMLGAVTIEVMLVARYWTWIFAVISFLSYLLVYPFVLLFPVLQEAIGVWDAAHFGVGTNLFVTAYFWISIVTVYLITFGLRYLERSSKWLFRPDDNMILAELECLDGLSKGVHTQRRLNVMKDGSAAHPLDDDADGVQLSQQPPAHAMLVDEEDQGYPAARVTDSSRISAQPDLHDVPADGSRLSTGTQQTTYNPLAASDR